MNIQQVEDSSQRLAKSVKSRYGKRSNVRESKLAEIDAKGVLGAADPAAVERREQHMCAPERKALKRKRRFEAMVGIDDSDPINFLSRGNRAARAVCRLTSGGQAVGTAFLVAPNILLTNNHVIPSSGEAAGFLAEFDYEYDDADTPRDPVVTFPIDPSLFVTSDADEGLDFTFVRVNGRSTKGDESLDRFGWIPLDPSLDKILTGEPALIIQHPRGAYKRVCVFAAELVDKLENFLHYTTDTDFGSSGSCVMNRSWKLVALHHAATESGRRRRGQPVIVNEGIRISVILNTLKNRLPVATGDLAEVYAEISKPEVIGDGRPQIPGVARMVVGDEPVREAARDLEAGTKIRVLPRDHFARREAAHFGYKPGFLGSISVPLPKLPDFLAGDAARLADGTRELKYTHYSSVMSRSRKLPILTAANIDGKLSKRLGRKDRRFEAADVWSYDPRIPQELQLKPAVYDRTDFDFGHMVRREDPVWGVTNTARMANDDTFYMTNCCPQHSNLNQRTWLCLEDAVLNSARANKARVSVFTGPVLSPHDPSVLSVQIPTAFWKVVAYIENGKLRAHGFMQDQTNLVRGIRVRPEALSGLDNAQEFQVSIQEIARVTSLDFGALLAADEMAGTGGRRRLNESLISELFPDADSFDESSVPSLDADQGEAESEAPSVEVEPTPVGVLKNGTAENVLARIRELLEQYHVAE